MDAEVVTEPDAQEEAIEHARGEERALMAMPIGGTLEQYRAYSGVGLLALNPEQSAALQKPFHDAEGWDAYDILPTGEIYVSQIHYRRRLNAILGPGSWALVPRGGYVKHGDTLCREYALVVRGHFIAEAIGECDYQPDNARMSYAATAEGAKSSALTRTCKDLGIASECWDKRFGEAFQRDYCVAVWRSSTKKPQWRRVDAKPWYDETGVVDPGAMPARTEPEPAQRPAPARQSKPAPAKAQPQGKPKRAPVATCPKCDSDKDVILSKRPENGRFYCFTEDSAGKRCGAFGPKPSQPGRVDDIERSSGEDLHDPDAEKLFE